jgi:hypothetical protein
MHSLIASGNGGALSAMATFFFFVYREKPFTRSGCAGKAASLAVYVTFMQLRFSCRGYIHGVF